MNINMVGLKMKAGLGRLVLLASFLTAGLGLHWGMVGIDYAVSQRAVDYGTTQRLSLRVPWGVLGRSRYEEKPDWKTADNRSDWLLISAGRY